MHIAYILLTEFLLPRGRQRFRLVPASTRVLLLPGLAVLAVLIVLLFGDRHQLAGLTDDRPDDLSTLLHRHLSEWYRLMTVICFFSIRIVCKYEVDVWQIANVIAAYIINVHTVSVPSQLCIRVYQLAAIYTIW